MTHRTVPSVGILGAGYMGLATGLSFARHRAKVLAFDTNPRVVRSLKDGRSPYHERGLNELLRTELAAGRFAIADSLRQLVEESEGIFVCLPTPRGPGGRIDLRPMRAGLLSLAAELRGTIGYRIVVVKSTVVPGTTAEVLEPLLRRATGKSPKDLGVANNPEFLAEGSMVRDAVHPERVVIGVSDRRSRQWLHGLYDPFHAPVHMLSPSGAELVKYGSNAFLAAKVSFANEIARLAERLGLNVDGVMAAVGADSRIGAKFLRAGPGFGGSCFDKDVRALVARSKELKVRFRTGESALLTNDDQLEHVLHLIEQYGGPLRGKTVAVLGLAFKAGTDDVRESRAFPIIRGLRARGARVQGHDPVARAAFAREWRDGGWGPTTNVALARTPELALRGADLAVLQADWPEYVAWDPRWSRSMRTPLVIDLRRALRRSSAARAGLTVVALGVAPELRNAPRRPTPRYSRPRRVR